MKNFSLFAVLLLCATLAHAQANDATKPAREYKFAFGVLGTYQAVGLQSEFRFNRSFAAKALGAWSFDQERQAEHGGAGIGLVAFFLPTTHRFIEPVVGAGPMYSWYHWDLNDTRGTIHDVNVGGAVGTNLRFSRRFRSGLNVFVGNGFRADYAGRKMSIVSRRLLVLPTLTLEVLL